MKDVEYYYGKYAERLLKPEHTAEAVNDILIERDAELKIIPVKAGVMPKTVDVHTIKESDLLMIVTQLCAGNNDKAIKMLLAVLPNETRNIMKKNAWNKILGKYL